MPHLIETWDQPESAVLRQSVRPRHLAWLDEHRDQLLAAGAKMDDAGEQAVGSFLIVDLDDRAAVERFIAQDPYSVAGLPARVVITRWRLAFLDRRSFLPLQT